MTFWAKLVLKIHYAYILVTRCIKRFVDTIIVYLIIIAGANDDSVIHAKFDDSSAGTKIMRSYYARNEIHSTHTLKKWLERFGITADSFKIIFNSPVGLRIANVNLVDGTETLTGKRLSFNSISLDSLPSVSIK